MGQALPRIAALYPPGARQGATVEVAVRGGGLEGARQLLVDGPGLTATLNASETRIDPGDQQVFLAKCGLCHDLRGPATLSRTPEQWTATVDRMIRARQAPIEAAERTRIVSYLEAAARASAGLTARITVAPDAAPGRREIRVVGANGTSTAFPFEVTSQPEALETEPNNTVEQAGAVTLPLTVSGQVGQQGDLDHYAFEAKKGERLVFNCSAYRLNESSQAVFYPVLYLYDPKGKELVRNLGHFGLDPLIDWTAPADGRYSVMIRDMLYRGTPGSIYRLSMGALPYGTHLFPPGGKRGTTVSATLSGENMAPAALQVPVPGDGPVGVSRIATGRGAFPFVAGDYPEYVEGEGLDARTITLPVSLNGRIGTAAETDRYAFTLAREALGPYTFEAFAARVGSPLTPRLTLKNARGNVLATDAPGRTPGDPRLDYTFTQPGEYTLEVADANDRGGAAHIYRVGAGPAAPDFAFSVSPDNPNLGPGASVYLAIRVQRRVGIPGDIEVTFPDLPPGVTAGRTVIRPEQNQAFAILTAAPDAKPGSFSLVSPVGTATVNGKAISRPAVPYEIYRINNNAQLTARSNLVVSVGPQMGWRVRLEPERTTLSPDSGPIKVRAVLTRNGIQGDLPFAILGIPQGVQGQQALLFRKGTSELTFTLNPTNGGTFASRSGAGGPVRISLALVNGREGEGMMMSSPPVELTLGTAGSVN